MDRNFSFESEYTTYLQIIRPLEGQGTANDDELSLDLGKFSITQPEGNEFLLADDDMADAEHADEVRTYTQITIDHRDRPSHICRQPLPSKRLCSATAL